MKHRATAVVASVLGVIALVAITAAVTEPGAASSAPPVAAVVQLPTSSALLPTTQATSPVPPTTTPTVVVTASQKPTATMKTVVKVKPVAKPKPKPVVQPKPVVKKPVYNAPRTTWVHMSAAYWRNHGALLGRYLPVSLGAGSQALHTPIVISTVGQAKSVLSYASSPNGLMRLRAQLLAAKLNIKSGAGGVPSFDLSEAERLVSYFKYARWSLLSDYNQNYVLQRAAALRAFNLSVVRKA